MPLTRRLPKRGFSNYRFKTEYAAINVDKLNAFEKGSVVTLEALKEKGIVKNKYNIVKILGEGDLNVAVTVKVDKLSKSAYDKSLQQAERSRKSEMIETIKNAWKIPDLRRRILYTLVMLMIYRLGSFIIVPFVDQSVLAQYISSNSVLGLMDVISGGNLKNFTIFAMSITPYINASIIMNLLTIAIPALERLQKQGEGGKKENCAVYQIFCCGSFNHSGAGTCPFAEQLPDQQLMVYHYFGNHGDHGRTTLLIWMGESITEKGIGNGVSLIIFISIVSKIPSTISTIGDGISAGNFPSYMIVVIIAFSLLAIMGIIEVQEGTRKIPVQYAKRVVGRKVYGGKNTHLPMKVNQSGVIPIIFASVLTMFPSTLASYFPNVNWMVWISNHLQWGTTVATVVYLLLIIAFSFFYTLVTFNPSMLRITCSNTVGSSPVSVRVNQQCNICRKY